MLGQTTLPIADTISVSSNLRDPEESDCAYIQLTSFSKGSYYICVCIKQILRVVATPNLVWMLI